jgi:hypothetical protein
VPIAVIAIGLLIAIGTARSSAAPQTPSHFLLVGYGTSSQGTQPAPAATHTAAGAGSPLQSIPFTISGKVSGLYPGKTLSLVLKITNPNTVSITVTSITTTVSNASSTCVAANAKVTSFSGHLVVGAGKSATTTVHATMVHSAPNACQGVVFPLHYSGVATEA